MSGLGTLATIDSVVTGLGQAKIVIADRATLSSRDINLHNALLTISEGGTINGTNSAYFHLSHSSLSMNSGAKSELPNHTFEYSNILVTGENTLILTNDLALNHSTLNLTDKAEIQGGPDTMNVAIIENSNLNLTGSAKLSFKDMSVRNQLTNTITISGSSFEVTDILSARSTQLTVKEGGYFKVGELGIDETSVLRVEGVTAYTHASSDTILDAEEILSPGTVIFAHHRPASDPYYLTYTPSSSSTITASTAAGSPMQLRGKLNLVLESGATLINHANNGFYGVSRVSGGHLITNDAKALGATHPRPVQLARKAFSNPYLNEPKV